MGNTIRFYYGFAPQTISFAQGCEYKPTDTLLYYLRRELGVATTREGCGVGDCGACTVVVAELREGKMVYSSINACLCMLPSLDGKWLIISDHLRVGNKLHPVQEALLKHYGVQCGFCTSGMLMSMFAMFKNTVHPSRQLVEERMTGNLCRCTGYRSIFDAAIEVCTGEPDHFTEHEPEVEKWMMQNPLHEFSYSCDGTIYYRPLKLADALVWHHREQHSSPCCGTSDLVVIYRKLGAETAHLLDLSAVDELQGITLNAQGLTFGASVSVDRVRTAVRETFPQIYKLLGRFASYQIRQVASLAGNIASSSPIGDSIPMLMAHHAVVGIARFENNEVVVRQVPMTEFVTGYKQNVLQHDELIHSIFIPSVEEGVLVRCYKVSNRRSVDIATVSLSLRYRIECGVCRDLELYYGGMAERVKRAVAAERALEGKELTPESIAAAREALKCDFTPISDARATADRRMELAQNLLEMLDPQTEQEVDNKRESR